MAWVCCLFEFNEYVLSYLRLVKVLFIVVVELHINENFSMNMCIVCIYCYNDESDFLFVIMTVNLVLVLFL